MIGFQIFSFVVLGMFFIGLIGVMKRKPGTISRLGALIILSIMGLILAVVIDPNISFKLAHWAGIGRGADLMIYLAILFLLFLAATLYFRVKRMHAMIVELNRHIAILEAEKE